MAREPSYPDDAPVGEPAGAAEDGDAKAAAADDKATGSKRTRQMVTGAAIGIGSAALVADRSAPVRWLPARRSASVWPH